MTPADEIILLHRQYSHKLPICRSAEKLDRGIDAKIRRESYKGLFFMVLLGLIFLAIGWFSR